MPSTNRPILVTLLSLGVLILAAIPLVGLSAWFKLPDLPLSIPEWYLPLKNALWGLSGLALAVMLFRGHPLAPRIARGIGLALAIWYWIDRLLLVKSEHARQSHPAAAALTIFLILGLFGILSHRSVRIFYLERHT